MSYSIEALAMAGLDYNDWGMDLKEWERIEDGPPPPHLYADEFEEREYEEDERYEDIKAKDVFNKRDQEVDHVEFLMRYLRACNHNDWISDPETACINHKLVNRSHYIKVDLV
ncbi:hypothetical protein Tco_0194455 [Tanacetum coccineum]